jgi:hypothetical protein
VVTDVALRGFGVADSVSAVFQSACPRNSLRNGRPAASFLDVQRLHEASGEWELVRTCISALLCIAPVTAGGTASRAMC